ncbi:MAG: phosphatase PAP2 family protein [Candidatus Berkelbacteria bacterium]
METYFDKMRFWDYHIYLYFYRLEIDHHFLSYIFFFFSKYGIVLIILSSVYLIWRGTIKAFFCAFIALSIAALADFVISIFWRRPHPFESHFGEVIQPIIDGMKLSASSFPSAHTYVAFAVATSIFLYGHKRLGLALFVIALMIGVSRIATGLHYPTDIVAGAFFGILSGILSYLIISKAQKNWR